MFTFRYYSTKTAEWHSPCRSANARAVMREYDKVAGKVTVPVIELLREKKVVLRIGLSQKLLMKLAVQGCRLRGATPAFKEKHQRLRARGAKAVKAGRNKLLDAMVV